MPELAAVYEWFGWGLVGLGVAIGAYGFVGDRAGGRVRCPKCWYDLKDTPADDRGRWTCPECGRVCEHERQLRRARPKRRIIALGLAVALLCNVPFAIPRMGVAGWVGAVPTTVLAMLAPFSGLESPPEWRAGLEQELHRRELEGQVHGVAAYLWGWRSCFGENLGRDPGTDLTYSMYDAGGIGATCGMTGTAADRVGELGHALLAFIDSPGWVENGGMNSMMGSAGRVLVTRASGANDRAIRALLKVVAAPMPRGVHHAGVGSAEADIAVFAKIRGTVVRPPREPVRLVEIARLVEDASGVPVVVEEEQIEEAPVFLATPLKLASVPRRGDELLDLAIAGLWGGREDLVTWTIEDGRVVVSHADGARQHGTRLMVYDVRDLVDRASTDPGLSPFPSRADSRDDLEVLIRSNVDPDSWMENGGDIGSIVMLGDRFVIQTTPRHHAAIVGLFEKLRGEPRPLISRPAASR